MMEHFDIFGSTDKGLLRSANEDQFLIATLTNQVDVQGASPGLIDLPPEHAPLQGELLVVADGIGGSAAGEIASREAVRALIEYVQFSMHWHLHEREEHEQQLLDEFSKALEHCQRRLTDEMAEHPEHTGMGTTLTAAYIAWPRAFVLHAGDSRCYRYRNGILDRITTDHTMAQKMVEAGQLRKDQVETSPWSHYVWNAVGGDDREPIPELSVLNLEPGDSLLLCSDGLTKHVSETRIADILDSRKNAGQICQRLVQEACDRGGSDNITVVLARFVEPEEVEVLLDVVDGYAETEEIETDPEAALVPGGVPATELELARAGR